MIWLWWVLKGVFGVLQKPPKLRRLQVSSHCNSESGLPMGESGLCQGESMKSKS